MSIIPSESTFSGAFDEFTVNDLAGRMDEALIRETLGQGIVGHVSRDSTAIPAREKPTPKGESEQNAIDHRPIIDAIHTPRLVGSNILTKFHSKSLLSERTMLFSCLLFF